MNRFDVLRTLWPNAILKIYKVQILAQLGLKEYLSWFLMGCRLVNNSANVTLI